MRAGLGREGEATAQEADSDDPGCIAAEDPRAESREQTERERAGGVHDEGPQRKAGGPSTEHEHVHKVAQSRADAPGGVQVLPTPGGTDGPPVQTVQRMSR